LSETLILSKVRLYVSNVEEASKTCLTWDFNHGYLVLIHPRPTTKPCPEKKKKKKKRGLWKAVGVV
jgi:hypothetical protein